MGIDLQSTHGAWWEYVAMLPCAALSEAGDIDSRHLTGSQFICSHQGSKINQ